MLAAALLILGAGAPHAGWMADPAPAPVVAPTPHPAARPPAAAALPPIPPNSAGPDPAAGVARPLYRMPDASGQVWEHADPAWLQAFVRSRNAQLAAPAPPPAPGPAFPFRLYPAASPCGAGGCPR